MRYTDAVREHFLHPRNVGEIPDADGIGSLGDPSCGDSVKVWIRVKDERLADIKFKVLGCPAAIATCSVMTELAMGKSLDDAYEIADEQIEEALGGLPDEKRHCSNLAAQALHEAIRDYIVKSIQKAGPGGVEIGDVFA